MGGNARGHEFSPSTELISWEVFAQYIQKDHDVVVMGPGAGIAYDSSLLMVARLLGRAGNLLVVDPKSVSHRVRNNIVEKGPIRGAGDIDGHLRQFKYLYDNDMEVALPQWVGPKGTCASTTLGDQQCDLIVDHNTSPFVTGSDDREERIYWLEKTYGEYFRILKPGGTLLLQTNNKRYKFGNSRGKIPLVKMLREAGFSVIQKKVLDKFKINLSEEEAELMRTVPIDVEIFDKISHNIKQDELGKYYFERSASQSQFVSSHESPDMYIARKVSS